MYLRETRRRNADGSEVCYVALAHNERDKDTGVSKPKVIHNFGRADQLDRAALARLVCSLSRFLEPAQAMAASMPGEVEILEARPMGTAYVADQLWSRLGIGAAIRRVAAGESARRVDPVQVERVIFAMVANRLSPTPLSKLAGAAWVSNRVFIDGLPALCDDACYRGMDFLLDALPALQEEVFFSVANLLNLEVDLLFFDGSSTYWERDSADGELLHDPDVDPEPAGDGERPGAHEAGDGQVSTDGGEAGWPVEAATRRYGRSKDHRGDLPQVVIGLAVTREGIPVRLWTFPGDTSEQLLLRTVKDDLRAWDLNRVIWVLDRGFTSAANRRYLQRGGGHYIMGEKLRGASAEAAAVLSRQGRYQQVAGNLRVKEVRVDDGTARDRFVICHNPEQAVRDGEIRAQIVDRLHAEIADSDRLSARKRAELAGALKTKPAFNRFLRTTPGGLLRVDKAKITADTRLDGKFLLRTSDESLSAADIAIGYKQLLEAERGFRDLKSTIELRPVYHHKDQRIQAHIQLCWLALLLLRVAETETGDTWRNLRDELERLHLVVLRTPEGTLAQRSELTTRHKHILARLQLPEPPRFREFTPNEH
ncbi:MAG: transposase [Pseudonocardiales bacterium]|nr:transposase [Pseudonocardiales bacterium]